MEPEVRAFLEERFGHIDQQFGQVNQRLDHLASRVDNLEGHMSKVEEEVRLAHVGIEGNRVLIQKVAEGVAAVDEKLDRYQQSNDRRFEDMHTKIDRQDAHILRRVEALERGRQMS